MVTSDVECNVSTFSQQKINIIFKMYSRLRGLRHKIAVLVKKVHKMHVYNNNINSNNNNDSAVNIPLGGSSCPLFQVKLD